MKEIKAYEVNGTIYEDKVHAEYEDVKIDLEDSFNIFCVYGKMDFDQFLDCLESETGTIEEFIDKFTKYKKRFLK